MAKKENKISKRRQSDDAQEEHVHHAGCEHDHGGHEHISEDQQIIQQKYFEMQMADAQMKQIQKQLQAIDIQTADINNVILYLDDLGKTKVGEDMFVPLAAGIFVKAKLGENDKVLINVGANTVVTKTIEESKVLIHKQLKEVESVREQLLAEFNKMAFAISRLEKELTEMIS